MLNVIPIEFLATSSATEEKKEEVRATSEETTWMKSFSGLPKARNFTYRQNYCQKNPIPVR